MAATQWRAATSARELMGMRMAVPVVQLQPTAGVAGVAQAGRSGPVAQA